MWDTRETARTAGTKFPMPKNQQKDSGVPGDLKKARGFMES